MRAETETINKSKENILTEIAIEKCFQGLKLGTTEANQFEIKLQLKSVFKDSSLGLLRQINLVAG